MLRNQSTLSPLAAPLLGTSDEGIELRPLASSRSLRRGDTSLASDFEVGSIYTVSDEEFRPGLTLEDEEPSPELTNFLDSIDFPIERLKDDRIRIALLNRLLRIERNRFLGSFRFINLDYFAQKGLRLLPGVLNRQDLQFDEQLGCAPASRWPIWLEGRSLPLRRKNGITASYIISGFEQGTVGAARYLFRLTLGLFLAVKIIESFPGAQSNSKLHVLLDDFLSSKTNGINSLLHFLSDIKFSYSWSVLLIIPVIGILRGLYYSQQSRPLTNEHIKRWLVFFHHIDDKGVYNEKGGLRKLFEKLFTCCGIPLPQSWQIPSKALRMELSFSWWQDVLRPLLPFSPVLSRLEHIERSLREDGRTTITSECSYTFAERQYLLLNFIVGVAERGHGFNKCGAILSLAKLTHGVALSQISLLREQGYSDEEIEAIFYVKTKAFEVLLAQSQRYRRFWEFKGVSKISALLYFLYIEDQRWALAASSNAGLAVLATIYNAAFLASIGELLYIFIQNMITYFDCPYRPFSFAHGYQYTHFYSQQCFRIYGEIFNTPVSGEDLEKFFTLLPLFDVSALSTTQYLANKGWQGGTFAQVMQALLTNQAPLIDIEIIGQDLSTVTSVQALVPQIPTNTETLYIGNVGLESLTSGPTIALAQGLPHLPKLKAFSVVNSNLGAQSSAGGVALAQWLGEQTTVEEVSFLNNFIGKEDELSVEAFANSMVQLPLKVIDFSYCAVGLTGVGGTVALVNTVRLVSVTLQQFKMKNNYVGFQGNDGLDEFLQILPQLTELQELEISGNNISDGNFFIQLVQTARTLPKLTKLYVQQTNPLPTTLVVELRQLLAGSQIETDLPIMISVAEAQAFVQQLPTNITRLDLSRRLSNPSPEVVVALFTALAEHCLELTEINLSDNQFGLASSANVIALAQGLAVLGSNAPITKLILNDNFIDFTDAKGSAALGSIWTSLPQLQHLEINNNALGITVKGSTGLVFLFQNFCFLPALSYVSLKGNNIDQYDSLASQALGTTLQQCRLPLSYIDISFNQLGNTDNQGIGPLFQGLASSASTLITVNGAYNYINVSKDTNTAQMILQAINQMGGLEQLFLHGAQGLTWSAVTQALQNTLQPTINQVELIKACDDEVCYREEFVTPPTTLGPVPASPYLTQPTLIGSNSIGADSNAISSGPMGSSRRLLTTEAKTHPTAQQESWSCLFQKSTDQLMCFSSDHAKMRVVTRRDLSIPWAKINGDDYHDCELMSEAEIKAVHCLGEHTEYQEYSVSATQTSPGLSIGQVFSDFSGAVAMGASLTAAPILVSHGLQKLGVNETVAECVGNFTQTALILASGSYLSSMVSLGARAVCKHVLMLSDASSNNIANMITVGMQAANDLTPVGLVRMTLAAGGAYVGSYLAQRVLLGAKSSRQSRVSEVSEESAKNFEMQL